MALVFEWREAGSSSWTTLDDTVKLGTIDGLMLSGRTGEADVITLTFENPDGALDLTGLRSFRISEDTAPIGDQNIFYGYIQARRYRRDAERGMLTGPANVIVAEITDLNSAMSVALIRATSGKRPAETATARVTWLLGLSNCPVADLGKVTPPVLTMDACDYRGQYINDVLGDIAAQSGYNYFAYFDEGANAGGLWMDDPNAGTYPSDLRISNVLSEIDGVTTFGPQVDAELVRTPERVAAGVWLPYANGDTYKTNSTTRANFAAVDRVAPMSNVKTKARADAVAARFLADNDSEEDRITVTVRLPTSLVNIAHVGDTIDVHFEHLPGYSDAFHYMYVMDRTIAQTKEDDTAFDITYTLSSGPPHPPSYPHATWFLGTAVSGSFPPSDPSYYDETNELYGSNDGSAWTLVLSQADLVAHQVANVSVAPIPVGLSSWRYWKWEHTDLAKGGYYRGVAYLQFSLYSHAGTTFRGLILSGHPSSGTYATGDFVLDTFHKLWLCTLGGTPGQWKDETASDIWAGIAFGAAAAPIADYDAGLSQFSPRSSAWGISSGIQAANALEVGTWTVEVPAT